MGMGKIASLALLGTAGALYLSRMLEGRDKYYSFIDRSVVITGGSRGFGLAIARAFAAEGACLTLLARDVDELTLAHNDLAMLGSKAQVIQCDIRDRAQVDQAFSRVMQASGHIDIVVNNAGVIVVGPQEHMTEEDYHEAMETHLFGPLHTIQAAVPYMRRKGGGRIVNISSIGGVLPIPHLAPYVASKFALTGLSQAMRTELLKDRILVTTVYPMTMRTGSAYNARFKGRSRRELNWFTLLDSLPITSVDASHAAQLVVEACRRGDAELYVVPPVRYLVVLANLFPSLASKALALFSALLPPPVSNGSNASHLGRDMRTPLIPSTLTQLTDSAARDLNELHRPMTRANKEKRINHA